MCGIIGYSGHRPAVPVLMEGLGRLEYRGYDSAGIGFIQNGKIIIQKAEGKLNNLEAKLASCPAYLATTGMGHTRWATHGSPTERNAHPHFGSPDLALVHNGIIENYQDLKAGLLAKGLEFESDTDTEVLAKLVVEKRKQSGSLLEAFAQALRLAEGAYSVVMVSSEDPHAIYAARLSAPLLIGVGVGECFVASDITAFLPYTRDVVFVEDNEILRIENSDWQIFQLADLQPVQRVPQTITWDMHSAQKGGYKHFMLKEIMEQPRVVRDCLSGRVTRNNDLPVRDLQVRLPELDSLPVPEHLRIVACGTSYYAGMWSRHLLENVGKVQTQLEIASEFRYRDPLLKAEDQVLVISQSGETLDTLNALRLAKAKGCRTIALCNVVGSSIAREADCVIYTQAGPEISVASTKAMCSQMALLALLAAYYAQRQGQSSAQLLQELELVPQLLANSLPDLHQQAIELSRKYAASASIFYLGRGPAEALAYEGALKLKELSYIHAEGYAAGEMKHGPIALIDPDFPSFFIALDNALLPKVISNMEEVKARQGRIIALVQPGFAEQCPKRDLVDDQWTLPACPQLCASFLALPALQLFGYEMADYLGKDVDQPRNLAKSVTVE